ncbi:kazal-type serine peptidase inhibitor domain 3 [Alosa sapidissima]|uniref:kazal-type serine peptidase inhibitor domain 3 n=1 Tax=Alosa sapidissima TaxID=34773 RepID=UPI001C0A457F|nr:kazal-type serine peptidase inhibitor domain 3 [Alosa sapidissima]
MQWVKIILALIAVSIGICDSFPNYKYEDIDEDLATFDYYRAMVEMDERNSTDCADCVPELCPQTAGCRAGVVLDSCKCCLECGNLEGQTCDLDDKNVYYGLCGSDLECKLDLAESVDGEAPEPQCVCVSQEPLCGSDGKTYMNNCKYKEAKFSDPTLNVTTGPCKTVPIIKVPPHDHVNVTGSSMALLCEVFAYPMALVEWRKDGRDIVLPGDDPHISVQSRGGPQKYELSSWLQIEEATQMDSGTYRCVARNELGNASASAILGVLPPDEMSTYVDNMKEMMGLGLSKDYDEDYY